MNTSCTPTGPLRVHRLGGSGCAGDCRPDSISASISCCIPRPLRFSRLVRKMVSVDSSIPGISTVAARHVPPGPAGSNVARPRISTGPSRMIISIDHLDRQIALGLDHLHPPLDRRATAAVPPTDHGRDADGPVGIFQQMDIGVPLRWVAAMVIGVEAEQPVHWPVDDDGCTDCHAHDRLPVTVWASPLGVSPSGSACQPGSRKASKPAEQSRDDLTRDCRAGRLVDGRSPATCQRPTTRPEHLRELTIRGSRPSRPRMRRQSEEARGTRNGGERG